MNTKRQRRKQLQNVVAVACACIQGGVQVIAFFLPNSGRKKKKKTRNDHA